eukprot:Phypoly_transcript_05787.p1 GENE.Phypoly_transcript_05787~~Phypoly_transcript_05787.p1  ORF type:complete len:549 (+),score=109.53 Phypoly_transcript_05787:167-1813(+)
MTSAAGLDQQGKAALKRLNADWKEIQANPISGVSAAPLESNIFEWHCNFDFDGTIYHVILYFPKNYPSKSPSAEFVPGIVYSAGATETGPKGGTKVCLSIFSDFAMYHTEWANEKGTGWSPSYTAQTVLLNLLSFLAETSGGNSYYGYGASELERTVANAKKFECSDCGHTHAKPSPPLAKEDTARKASKYDEITCYATRLNIQDVKGEIFGFGISKEGNDKNPNYKSPCEYITLEGFEMLKANGKVESVMREEIQYFIPLYINPAHGKNIQTCFEKSLSTIAGNPFDVKLILNIIPKLMNSAVVQFMNGTTHTSERALHGYFAFHRLFIWASTTYKLLPTIDDKLKTFVSDPKQRLKQNTPNLGDWLTYLTVSPDARWENVCVTFVRETFLRNVMWVLKDAPALANLADAGVDKVRAQETFRLTQVSRDLTAFQVLFLDIARPKELPLQKVAERYDANNGLPTEDMEAQMSAAVKRIKGSEIKSYQDWFALIKVPCPPPDKLLELLKSSVSTAATLDGYSMKGGGGGGRGGGGGGRGGGRGGRGRGY